MEQEIATQVAGLGGATDFSLLQLFLRADFVVKSVIIILIASSVYSWALIFEKYKLFKKINITTEEFENKFWKSKSAESFNNSLPAKSADPVTLIFKDAMTELLRTKSKSSAVQTARVERVKGSVSSGRESAELSGKSTCTPTVNNGAVTMKIINKTNITSTKGVTLISLIGSFFERLNLKAMIR